MCFCLLPFVFIKFSKSTLSFWIILYTFIQWKRQATTERKVNSNELTGIWTAERIIYPMDWVKGLVPGKVTNYDRQMNTTREHNSRKVVTIEIKIKSFTRVYNNDSSS